MTPREIKARYDALKDSPNASLYWGGMNGWFDRITPFEEFMRRGQEVADAMRGTEEENRDEFPELWDLLFEVFPGNKQ
jgi:hypothetical protein